MLISAERLGLWTEPHNLTVGNRLVVASQTVAGPIAAGATGNAAVSLAVPAPPLSLGDGLMFDFMSGFLLGPGVQGFNVRDVALTLNDGGFPILSMDTPTLTTLNPFTSASLLFAKQPLFTFSDLQRFARAVLGFTYDPATLQAVLSITFTNSGAAAGSVTVAFGIAVRKVQGLEEG